MQNLWQQEEADTYTGELALRVYSSRLLGRDPSLVLHGGGNTSVKIEKTNIFAEKESLLYVKGSGWDLQTIEEAGFAPVKMHHLLKLAQLKTLSDTDMVNELKTACTDPKAPTPSVETILHALLPYKYVDHTHADAIISITNTAAGEERIRKIYGNKVVIIPYIMPGFDLSKLCATIFPTQQTEETIGMVLLNHGIFSFGNNAKESYDRMIELVGMAEDYLQQHNAWTVDTKITEKKLPNPLTIAALRKKLSDTLQQPLIIRHNHDDKSLSFCQLENLNIISQQGPATPDHVIRTKQLPLIASIEDAEPALEQYKNNYQRYFENNKYEDLKILDALPRIILDPHSGLYTMGKTYKDACIVEDIYQHTMDIIQRSEMLEQYRALAEKDIFDVEYWELEQAKLKKNSQQPEFQGEIALVTGAASGIGKACAESLLERGSIVVGLDINSSVKDVISHHSFLGLVCDIRDEKQIQAALTETVVNFGGLDMLILNAGIFPKACEIKDMEESYWKQVMSVNLDANVLLLKQAYPYLKLAPNHGRVSVIGSKNVPAPGPGAAAYSASKAALNQLIRVTALEWAKDKIRLNSVHPNAVFDTAIWQDDVLAARAEHYGLSIEEYKSNNLLKTKITSHDVAELAVSLCGKLFSKTTAAQIPIDGGNERVI